MRDENDIMEDDERIVKKGKLGNQEIGNSERLFKEKRKKSKICIKKGLY